MKITKKKPPKRKIRVKSIGVSYTEACLVLRDKETLAKLPPHVKEALGIVLSYQEYLDSEMQTLSREVLSLGKEILDLEK